MKKIIAICLAFLGWNHMEAYTMDDFIFQVVVSESPNGPFSACFDVCQGGTIYVKNVSVYGGTDQPCVALKGGLGIWTGINYATVDFIDGGSDPNTNQWYFNEVISITLSNTPLVGQINNCGPGSANVYFNYDEETWDETDPAFPGASEHMRYGRALPAPDPDAGPDEEICLGETVTLTGSGAGSPSWSGPNGTICTNCVSADVTPTTTTTYTFSLTGDCGSATDQMTITVINANPDLGPDLYPCLGEPAPVISVPNVYTSYNWTQPSPGNCLFGTYNMQLCNNGEYCLAVTDASGCEGEDCVYVTYVDCTPCIVDSRFTATIDEKDCSTVTFENTSSGNEFTTVTGYLWQFGDGTTSNEFEPTHTYYYNGSYIVYLTVYGVDEEGNCCTESSYKIVDIDCKCEAAKPQVWTSMEDECTYHFSEVGSADGTAHIVGWQWYFGDGSYGYGQEVTHVFPQNGTYTVSVSTTLFNGKECCTSEPKFIEVEVSCYSTCKVDNIFNLSIDGGYVNFTNSSVGLGTTEIIGYLWDFGDGNTSTEENPFHTYYTPGIYHVCLTVIGTNAGECCSEIRCVDIEITEVHKRAEGGQEETMHKTVRDPSLPWLDQNMPNPFSGSTTLRFYIPAGVAKAELVTTNLMGETVKTIAISQSGIQELRIEDNELAVGTYTMTLYVDGIRIDSKRIIKLK